MEKKKQYAPIYDKLLPIYKAVATPTYRGNSHDTKIAIGTKNGEERWERNAVGNEGVLVLDEYRRNGRNYEPRFSYNLEKHGIRCDHSDTSFLMVLHSVRNKFAEVTGMTFRDWLEANGEPVDHLYENTAREKRVAFAYREDTPEEAAARAERSLKLDQDHRSQWKDVDMFSEEDAPEHKATRVSQSKLEKKYKEALSQKAQSNAASVEKTEEIPAKKPATPPVSTKNSAAHPAEQMDLLF